MHKWIFRAAAVATGLAGLLAAASPVHARHVHARHVHAGKAPVSVTVNVPYISRTRIDGVWTPIDDYSRDFTVTAPTSVSPGRSFTVTFDSAPIFAVPTFNKQLTDVRIAYRVTGAGTVTGCRLRGGSNLGNARFWVERHGADLVVRSDGYFPGGVEFDVPDLEVTVRAGGTGTVTTSPGGSSFDDPAFYWFREQTSTGQWDPFQNYVDPAAPVTFTTTAVG